MDIIIGLSIIAIFLGLFVFMPVALAIAYAKDRGRTVWFGALVTLVFGWLGYILMLMYWHATKSKNK